MPPLCPQHSGLDERVTANTKAIETHADILRKIQSRPPAWCTLVISLLTFSLGFTLNAKKAGVIQSPEPRTQNAAVTALQPLVSPANK